MDEHEFRDELNDVNHFNRDDGDEAREGYITYENIIRDQIEADKENHAKEREEHVPKKKKRMTKKTVKLSVQERKDKKRKNIDAQWTVNQPISKLQKRGAKNIVKGTPGPVGLARTAKTEESSFSLFITDEMLDFVVDSTDGEDKESVESRDSRPTRISLQ